MAQGYESEATAQSLCRAREAGGALREPADTWRPVFRRCVGLSGYSPPPHKPADVVAPQVIPVRIVPALRSPPLRAEPEARPGSATMCSLLLRRCPRIPFRRSAVV